MAKLTTSQVHQAQPHLKGIISVCMCIKFKVDIETNVQMFSKMDGKTDT